MYWASGKGILGAAKVVSATPGLYGVFVTSFSCGPDSFILESFRSIMEDKPYLVLELDAHTADAGVDTRVEAFLDIGVGGLLLAVAFDQALLADLHQVFFTR